MKRSLWKIDPDVTESGAICEFKAHNGARGELHGVMVSISPLYNVLDSLENT